MTYLECVCSYAEEAEEEEEEEEEAQRRSSACPQYPSCQGRRVIEDKLVTEVRA
jgi:hypothetical protein